MDMAIPLRMEEYLRRIGAPTDDIEDYQIGWAVWEDDGGQLGPQGLRDFLIQHADRLAREGRTEAAARARACAHAIEGNLPPHRPGPRTNWAGERLAGQAQTLHENWSPKNDGNK